MLSNKKWFFLKGNFTKNVITLVTGTAMAQVIAMIFSPIITRIYGPEIYGVFGVFVATTALITPVIALTFPVAIVLPKRSREAKVIAYLSIIISIFVSFILLLIIFFFNEKLINGFKLNDIGNFLYLIPMLVLFEGIFQTVYQYLIRLKKFKIISKVSVQQSLFLNISYSLFGFISPISWMLVSIFTISKSIFSLMFIKKLYNIKTFIRRLKNELKTIKYREFKNVFKNYSDFPKYRAPQVLINSISESLPVLLLASFFGPTVVAFYTIGVKVLGMPTQLIGNAIGSVFYPRIAEAANNNENITRLLVRANGILAVVGIIPFGIIIIFGPWLFGLVYGSNWQMAGEFARWLALWSYLMLITRPTIKILPVLNAQRFHLVYTVILIMGRLIALLVGAKIYEDALIAIILYSIVGAVLYLILAITTITKTKSFQYKNTDR